ncbi:MAG: nucleotide excision repair endonuclease [Oligoflexia bacterium]|nr:nucleotide excision repair endonuclease [Oligoflexia bacterium]
MTITSVARLKTFDKNLGDDFLASIPPLPGVYLVFDAADTLIYVGKAKNLRRRLSQYRNAKRRKKHLKMREIVRCATRIEHRLASSELEAEILETRLIQEHRPRFNVAGAFSFLYPAVGMRWEADAVSFCYTCELEAFARQGFEMHGAFRSRFITGEAFFALMRLLSYVGHRMPGRARAQERGSYLFRFRRVPGEWADLWQEFWKGESNGALESLILRLVENAAARKNRAEVQDGINALLRFWEHEARALRKARLATGHAQYPVPQRDRDVLFLNYRHRRRGPLNASAAC